MTKDQHNGDRFKFDKKNWKVLNACVKKHNSLMISSPSLYPLTYILSENSWLFVPIKRWKIRNQFNIFSLSLPRPCKHLSEMLQWASLTGQAELLILQQGIWHDVKTDLSISTENTEQFQSSLALSGEMQMPCIIQIRQTTANTDIKHWENIAHILKRLQEAEIWIWTRIVQCAAFIPSEAKSSHTHTHTRADR